MWPDKRVHVRSKAGVTGSHDLYGTMLLHYCKWCSEHLYHFSSGLLLLLRPPTVVEQLTVCHADSSPSSLHQVSWSLAAKMSEELCTKLYFLLCIAKQLMSKYMRVWYFVVGNCLLHTYMCSSYNWCAWISSLNRSSNCCVIRLLLSSS